MSCLGPKLERESLQRPIKKMYWFIGPHHYYNRNARSAPLSSLDYIRKYACNNASQSKHESLHLPIRVKHGCRWPSWLCVRTSKLQNLQNEVQQQQLGTGSRPAPLAKRFTQRWPGQRMSSTSKRNKSRRTNAQARFTILRTNRPQQNGTDHNTRPLPEPANKDHPDVGFLPHAERCWPAG